MAQDDNTENTADRETAPRHSLTMDDVFAAMDKAQSEREAKPLHGPIRNPPPDPPAGDGYDPLWNIGGGTNEEREQFRRTARLAVAALGHKLADPIEAIDFWLTEMHRFLASRNSQYARDRWRVRSRRDAAADYCAEIAVRAVEAGKQDIQTRFKELEQEFRYPPGVVGSGLYAILRREPTESHIERLKADTKAATACMESADDPPRAESAEGTARRIGRPPSIRIKPDEVLRIRGNTSQASFARLLKVKKGTVIRAEKGLASEKTIIAIVHRAQTAGMRYIRDQLIVPDHQ